MHTTMTQYAWTKPENGMARVRLQDGDSLTSFRGEQWFFVRVSRPAQGNSTGRVTVKRDCPNAYRTMCGARECVHMWHHGGVETTEYFPSVFGLYLGDAEGNEV